MKCHADESKYPCIFNTGGKCTLEPDEIEINDDTTCNNYTPEDEGEFITGPEITD